MRHRNHYRFKGLALVAMLALLTTAAAQAQARFTTVNAATALQTNGVTRIDSSGNVTAGTISGSTITATGTSTLVAVNASGLITGNAGITVPSGQTLTSAGTATLAVVNASGLVTANAGLTVPSGQTLTSAGTATLAVVNASGLVTANGGITVASGQTTTINGGLTVAAAQTLDFNKNILQEVRLEGIANASEPASADADKGRFWFSTDAANAGSARLDRGNTLGGIVTLWSVAAGNGALATDSNGVRTLAADYGPAGDLQDVSLTAAAAGTDVQLARSDHRHVLNQAIVPTWTGAHTFNADVTAAAIVNLTGTADGLGLNKVAGVPGTVTEGEFWYDNDANRLKYRDDNSTESVASLSDSGEMRMGTVACTSNALTKTVIFSTAYSDATFKVALANSGANYVFAKVANKTTTGFDIELEANPNTSTFDYITMK